MLDCQPSKPYRTVASKVLYFPQKDVAPVMLHDVKRNAPQEVLCLLDGI